jgi:hypothetical protein
MTGVNPFELPGTKADQAGGDTRPASPSWLRFHPIDGPMVALLGAFMAALGWNVEGREFLEGGAAFVLIGALVSVHTWRSKRSSR